MEVATVRVNVTPDSRTVRSRLADSPRGIARYLSGRMWDLLVSFLFLLISSRAGRSSTAHLDVAPSPRSPSSGHPNSIPCVSTFPSPSSSFPNLQTGSSRPESFPPPPDAIGGVGAQFHRRSASPVALHSNRPREWTRGEFLMLHSLFSPSMACRRRRSTASAVVTALAAA